MTASHWSLHRLGWEEPSYVLQSHLQVISLGRSMDVTKQLLGKVLDQLGFWSSVFISSSCFVPGKQVSRRHCEFRQVMESNRLYWLLRDSGSSTKTFLNGSTIPAHQDIRK